MTNKPFTNELTTDGEIVGRYELWSNWVKLYTPDGKLIFDKNDDYFGAYYNPTRCLVSLENRLRAILTHNSRK